LGGERSFATTHWDGEDAQFPAVRRDLALRAVGQDAEDELCEPAKSVRPITRWRWIDWALPLWRAAAAEQSSGKTLALCAGPRAPSTILVAGLSGAARTSVKGARIECDKQRRQRRSMINPGNKLMRHEAGTHRFRYLRYPTRLAFFAMEAQKPDNSAHLSRNLRKNFPKCERPHTSRPIHE